MDEAKPKKKKSSSSPTQRSLKYLRDQGYLVDVVERWIRVPNHPGGGKRRDLFGFIDLLAIRENEVLAIQATSDSGVSARVKKIKSEDLADNLAAVRQAGIKIHVHGWKKNPLKNRWQVRVVDLS